MVCFLVLVSFIVIIIPCCPLKQVEYLGRLITSLPNGVYTVTAQ